MRELRACRVIGCCLMTMRYDAIRQDDPVLRERLKELARVRLSAAACLASRREGLEVNYKRLLRIYREERLHLRRRGGRKRAPMALMPNQRWSLDFVSDQLTDGRRFRVLTVVDDCTRECLALITDTSLSGARVARELATLFEARGKPMTVVSDIGTEFTSNAILTFADDRKIVWPSPMGSNQWRPNGSASRLASRPRTPSSRASCIDGPAGASVLNVIFIGRCVHVFGLFVQPIHDCWP
jgi:putative transposase